MHINTLEAIPLQEVVDCLNDAFSDYFVPMPSDITFWEKRFKAGRVDWSLSQGVYDDKKLVAFITNGVDKYKGGLTAFNSGTGVIKDYRGQQLVDKMYTYALPKMQAAGVKKCMLEVIQANARAIRVYERIGFTIVRSLKCYKGTLELPIRQVAIEKISFADILKLPQPKYDSYSWDNTDTAIKLFGDYTHYIVKTHNDDYIGYFSIQPKTGYIAQLEAKNDDFESLFSGILQTTQNIRINNVDSQRVELIKALQQFGVENPIDQFEMEMRI